MEPKKNPISFKRKMWRLSLIMIAAYLVLFAFRLLYGYSTQQGEFESNYISDFFSEESFRKKNYASDKYSYKKEVGGDAQVTAPAAAGNLVSLTQNYEKTASIRSKTGNFDSDRKKLNKTIKTHTGIIQFEKAQGNKGDRELHLMIGIKPHDFDTFYNKMLKIGNIRFKEITKTDKTSEFKTLNAKRASLETIRASLLELKKRQGEIKEYINLENRILEIEEQLQELGVSLGDYEEENEFCTVKFSLVEGMIVHISLMHRFKVAFEWSLLIYMQVLAVFLLVIFSSYFLILLIDKIRQLVNLLPKPGSDKKE
jgi:hypothetical protein